MKKALIIVDVQNDFCKGGSLEVPNANEIINPINSLMVSKAYDYIVATMDWHPDNHSSFLSNNSKSGLWPKHCVQNTDGAKLHKQLSRGIDKLVYKGTNTEVDSYSGFFDNDHLSETELDKCLKANNIKELDIVGLALDYCVKATALDAIKLGYKVNVILEATKAVNINSSDEDKAIKELIIKGVSIK